MRFKDVFSIIGPAMIGPSSSHTAGAARIGFAVRQLLGEQPLTARIELFGSFADTYAGHGTDFALVGGLLGLAPDDPGLPESMAEAARLGMAIDLLPSKGVPMHPNTARISARTARSEVVATAASIGGGNIEIQEIDGFEVKMSCAYPTIVLVHLDRQGIVASISAVLTRHSLNIANMQVKRSGRFGETLTVLELDDNWNDGLLAELTAVPDMRSVRTISLEMKRK
ncbi:L-serine ammonia-lyase, iron-sulfur-dependent subunit beta [Cohnella faecalis]|uniref:L-serine deaminase n=1 Tax=Cohnella faecalis TaxID=2315694 RepID=A0A398CH87_9BACL|nr:L-serine ammonia-lyase, iron-sulfur-dependent subunit beta [Cohnella faecalis]RIE00459.1 L-serine ammonia-lyase, iron-sulfur-dependent, subunit beta [Cohnella faecalis]